MVAREKRAWDSKDVELLMSLLHPDMVWPFPGEDRSLDPMTWTAGLGRYDAARWSGDWQSLFDDYELVHNRREIRRIVTAADASDEVAATLLRATLATMGEISGRVYTERLLAEIFNRFCIGK